MAGPNEVTCPNCGRSYAFDDPNLAGKRVRCQSCRQAFVVRVARQLAMEPGHRQVESSGPSIPAVEASGVDVTALVDLAGSCEIHTRRTRSKIVRAMVVAVIAAGVWGFVGLAVLRDSPEESRTPHTSVDDSVKPVKFDFQGMKIAEPTASVNSRIGHRSGTIRLEGSDITVSYTFQDGNLISVALYFDANQFEDIVKAYTNKFGVPPHRVNQENYTTRIGATYTNYIATWETDSGPFIVRRFGRSVDKGYAFLYSPAYARWSEKQQHNKEKNLREQL